MLRLFAMVGTAFILASATPAVSTTTLGTFGNITQSKAVGPDDCELACLVDCWRNGGGNCDQACASHVCPEGVVGNDQVCLETKA